MRQFLILLCFFSCAFVLADHDGSEGYSYNDRTFQCNDEDGDDAYTVTKKFAEIYDTGVAHYNYALCQLHHGPKHFMAGIASLQTAASKGFHAAAISLAGYYISDGYDLQRGKRTKNQSNLQKAIEYRKLALQIINSLPDYPFSDLDNRIAEREDHLLLDTAENLAGAYVRQFGLRVIDHLNGTTTTTDIRNSTLESLENARVAADSCLKIPGNTDIWNKEVHTNAMDRCRTKKEIALALLPLEQERLDIIRSQCQGILLSECEAHTLKKEEMLQLYLEYVKIAKTQLAAL